MEEVRARAAGHGVVAAVAGDEVVPRPACQAVVALTAPDSMLAVVPRERVDTGALRARLTGFSGQTRVAIGTSQATLNGEVVDGPALDVESWAPYPLPDGLWVADGL